MEHSPTKINSLSHNQKKKMNDLLDTIKEEINELRLISGDMKLLTNMAIKRNVSIDIIADDIGSQLWKLKTERSELEAKLGIVKPNKEIRQSAPLNPSSTVVRPLARPDKKLREDDIRVSEYAITTHEIPLDIPGYRIISQIGSGGMATVYKGIQENLQRTVAIKVMAPALAADQSFGTRFFNETRLVAQLDHPNIISVHDIGAVGHTYYLTMAYMSGGDIKPPKAGVPTSPDKALRVISQISDALQYAHSKNFIHRDVKPENILCSEHGNFVLTDFGIAKVVGEGGLTGTGMAIGSAHYMSPEQAQGSAKLDGRTDIYSLGVVLYELLTGHMPYSAENMFAVAMQHISAPLPLLPSHLKHYQYLIDRMMAKSPADRFSNAREINLHLLAGG